MGGTSTRCWNTLLATTEPETGTAYSDPNFMLLGPVGGGVSGLSLRQALERLCQSPWYLGYGLWSHRSRSGRAHLLRKSDRAAHAQRASFDGWRPNGVEVRAPATTEMPSITGTAASGHAGIFATADALSRSGAVLSLPPTAPWFLRALRPVWEERGLGFDWC